MGLDLWFQADVARILASTQETMAATMSAAPALDPEQAEAYRQGFTAAIRAVAVAFGIAAPQTVDTGGQRAATVHALDVERAQSTNGCRSP